MTDSAGPAFVAATLLVANIGCSVAVAVRVASRVADDRLDRALVATLLGIAQGVGVPLLLAMLGIAYRIPVTVLHLVILAATLRFIPPKDSGAPRRWSVTAGLSAALSAVLLVWAAAPVLRALQTTHGETRHYHIVNLTAWLQRHTLWTLPFQNPGLPTATHPGNAEMFGLWLALPSHGDQFVYVTVLPFALLAVLACASIARDLGGEPGWGALCATAVMAAPHLFRTHAFTLASDLPAAAGIAASVPLLLRTRAEPERRSWIVLAGLALGLGLGSKYTVLIPSAVVLAWCVVMFKPRSRVWLLLPGLVLLAAPWFVRNLVETGNPVFPQEVKVAGRNLVPGVESPYEQLATTMAEHVVDGRTEVIGRWGRLAAELWGPVTLLALGGVAAAFLPHELRRRRAAGAALALLCGAVYMVLPLSGGGPEGLEFLIGSNLRYALPALLLGSALAAATLPVLLRGALAASAFGYGFFRIFEGTPLRLDLDLRPWSAALGIVAGVIVYLLVMRPPNIGVRTTAAALIAASLVGAWGITLRTSRSLQPTPLELAVARAAGNDTVIVLGPTDLRSILGKRLDRELVTLSNGGAADERAFTDQAQLTRALEGSPWSVLVVSTVRGVPAVPVGWVPPATWRLEGRFGTAAVYLRGDRAS
jgi:4-amino-4-deoxy-L-arabinose transferase-like glycosyltransferase